MKERSFDDWWQDGKFSYELGELTMLNLLKKVWEESRQGMIPEDEAVSIPPVSEWPGWAKSINVFFHQGEGQYTHQSKAMVSTITVIPRTTPVWIPKIGEPVFLLVDMSGKVGAGKVVEVWEDRAHIVIGGTVLRVWIPDLKPFNLYHLGKRWDEIPGVPS